MRARLRILGLMSVALLGCGDDGSVGNDAGDATTDVAAPGCSSNADCDDGLFCNGAETCVDGVCTVGTAPDCADAVECTLDLCDEETDTCVNVAPDEDGDGVRDAACLDADGTPLGEDCDDDDANRYPGNREVCDEEGHDEDCDPETFGAVDRDSDGYLDARCCNERPDGTRACGDDCDDVRPNVNLSATEACDGVDNDCNGNIDEGVLVDGFVDADRDGFGDPTMPLTACPGRSGFVPAGGAADCDDADVARNPGQVEVCDGIDNDCNGLVDDDPSSVTWYLDVDGDGFGSATSGTIVSCSPPARDPRGSYSLVNTDCNDAVAAINPAAAEVCDAVDNDCNGVADFEVAPGDFEDDDADGLADTACGAPRGTDCDDHDPATGTGVAEACDGRDNDCDGSIDEGATDVLWFYDGDGDGHGSSADPSRPVVRACSAPPGYVGSGADCDDTDPARRPGAAESCNLSDDDCDGSVDEGGVCGCPPGLLDCDGDGICEVNSDFDENHCGGCGNVCSPGMNGQSVACISGSCWIQTCDPGYIDCDGDVTNGCEISIWTDVMHCGGCGLACPATAPNVDDFACVGGRCEPICRDGFMDCNGDPLDGCETDVATDVDNCGACGASCNVGPAPAPVVCAAGMCAFECGPGTADCSMPADGICETFLGEPDNCGGCGLACTPTSDAWAFCDREPTGGFVCRRDCKPGWADCDGDPSNGCEAVVDPNNCSCPVDASRDCTVEFPGRVVECRGFEPGVLGARCEPMGCVSGFRDCDGLCADVANDPNNCGGCGNICPPGESCIMGMCSPMM